jgi:hypothetical protein
VVARIILMQVVPLELNAVFLPEKRQGKLHAKGHFSHTEVHAKHNLSRVYIPPVWNGDWGSVITHHIALLEPKPEYLVFNAGLWVHDLDDDAVRESIKQALRSTGIVGIYKTTTFTDEDFDPATFKKEERCHDAHVCELMQNRCLDMSWTMNLTGPLNYWDRNHFRAHAYTSMNLQLLKLLNDLHSGSFVGHTMHYDHDLRNHGC